MRRLLPALLAFGIVLAPCLAAAQADGDDTQDTADASIQQAKEFDFQRKALPKEPNLGPCPLVRVLYDAARYIDFKGGQEAASQVTYSGEISGINSDCVYKGKEPIRISLDLLFDLGKGPQATAAAKTYTYWVAVTDVDKAVIAKQYFTLPVTFQPGKDRVQLDQPVQEIVIPRASADVSGDNFEVLVGFDVTPDMAAFNRDGKRFQMQAGQAQPAAAPAPAAAK